MPRKSKKIDFEELKKNSLEYKENKTPLEHEIVIQKKEAERRKRKGQPPKIKTLVKDYSDREYEEPKGSPIGVCKTCGNTFQQDFSIERNAYSNYRICPDCKKAKSKKQEEKIRNDARNKNSTEVEIAVATLPYTPFEAQKRIHEAFEKHRFVVIDAGNRFGKDRCSTMMGIKYFIECLQENRHIDEPDMTPSVMWWIIAPTEKMAAQNWRELVKYFPNPDDWVVACSSSTYTMQTIGGGIIEVRSAFDPDTLRGVGLDLVTLTEAAVIKDLSGVWANLEARLNSPGRGRKKDRLLKKSGSGKAIINSSPVGRNYFYTMWTWGQSSSADYDPDWWSCKCSWTDNPENAEKAKEVKMTKYGLLTYEERLRRRIGERLYRQNYLGDFIAGDNFVFRNFEENCVISIYNQEITNAKTKKERDQFISNWREVVPGQTYIAGYDPATGSSGDSPALVIRCKETGRVVRVFDLYGKTYEQQYDFIESICKMYNYAEVHWLRTGHTAIEGQFSKRGLIEVPIDEQGQKKGQLVQTLELAVENKDVHVLHDGSEEIHVLINQMNDYSENKGKYSNDKMPHDDFVSAMYAAFSDYVVSDVPIYYCGIMRGLK